MRTSDWINVEERSSDDEDIILCCDRDDAMFIGYRKNGVWKDMDGNDADVAYWMELPPSPLSY